MLPKEGRSRAVIEGVSPSIDEGRFAIKRIVGELIVVEVDVFTDGHDELECRLLYRQIEPRQGDWTEVPMRALGNDRWRASFSVHQVGKYEYTIEAWVDRFLTWRRDLVKRHEAKQNLAVEMLVGADLLDSAASRAPSESAKEITAWSKVLRGPETIQEKVELALSDELLYWVRRYPDRSLATRASVNYPIIVDRERARFSSWYELFPRSTSTEPGKHGTFEDCETRLQYVASLGFDVVYLPPIHPIGLTNRKGKNNSTTANPDEPGSPWGIGAKEGGHKAIHSELGTLEDFQRLVKRAKQLGMEVALDVALQCSPDHPYAKEHANWFRQLPDGTIRYAENPPKKYQDIYPFDYESEDWKGLWEEGKSIFEYWIEQGVQIFRVDNPHTKAFAFWEWAITEIKKKHPEVLFLAEAFTRPKAMYRLAKLGFSQSYTYFAWRNSKHELQQYFTELTQTQAKEFFRPNLWPNTPDILTEYLQFGGRPAFMIRLILAATLGASYGIYGPTFELAIGSAKEAGSEEYWESEKYEFKHWDLDHPESLKYLLQRVNRIRNDNPALQSDRNLRFHVVENEDLIAYSKQTDDSSNIIITIVNLSPYHTQSGWLHLPVEEFGLDPKRGYQVHDLLSDARYLWQGGRNFVQLNPHEIPAHILRIRRFVRSEHNFEYYL